MANDTVLLGAITNAVRSSFDTCRRRIGAAQIIGYAICSDDTAITCSPVAASIDGLASFIMGNPDDFRFNPELWDVQEDVDELRAVNDAIYSLYEQSADYENNENWHQEHRARIYELMVQSLERLNVEGYFGADASRDGIFVMAWVVDSLVPRQLGPDWSRRLNSPDTHHAFVKWLASTNYWG